MKVKFKLKNSPPIIHKIECAQGFNVIKLSEQEALKARQGIKRGVPISFMSALELANIKYKQENVLKENECYTGYIAIFICMSEIFIAHLDGALFIKKKGDNISYTTIGVNGYLHWVDDTLKALERALKKDNIKQELYDKACLSIKHNSAFDITDEEFIILEKICQYIDCID